MEAVFRFLENFVGVRLQHLGGDFFSAVSRQAVQHHRTRVRHIHHGLVHLVARKGGAALLGYMIVLSAAAFTIWTALLGRFPVGRVSLFGFLIPVFGAVFSALVLGENIMTVRNLLSLLLVSGGIALANSAAASSKS